MRFVPHSYQERAVRFIVAHPYCGLFLQMGLGKTVSALTAVDLLRRGYLDVERTLVIAPKSVALNTWTTECLKWDHLKDTRVSVVMGGRAERLRALETEADLYVTSRDLVAWLVRHLAEERRAWPFDCVIVDESSSFKNFQSKRFKALFSVRPLVRRMILLTGTPAPNGLMDLWAQMKLLDLGERLGRYIGGYRDRYFRPGMRNGAVVYSYVPRKESFRLVSEKISDICLSLQASDYLTMPMLFEPVLELQLPPEDRRRYDRFERECLMPIDGTEIEAVTAVALTNKLLQFAGGAVYDDEHVWHATGTAKLDALRDLCDTCTDSLLVYCNYRHEQERILAAVPEALVFHGEPEILRAWNAGEIRVLLAHPASVAYGLNMQDGGHVIVWYSPTWNLELYQQANARLYRQGQRHPVTVYHLVCKGTMDEAVMGSLRSKDGIQTTLLRRIKTLNAVND